MKTSQNSSQHTEKTLDRRIQIQNRNRLPRAPNSNEWSILEETLKINKDFIPHTPTKMQAWFLALLEREILYGGSAGGGKTDALLMAALQYVHVSDYAAIIFRRSFTDLELADALVPRSKAWLTGKAKWRGDQFQWAFPSGATLSFGYMSSENDKYRYQGAQFQFIGFDELTHFCLVPDTEVLTEDGWKPIPDVLVGERVASLSPDWEMSYEKVTHTHHYPFKGNLIEVKARSINYVATPNHKVVIRGQKNKELRLSEVKDLPNFAYHPQTAKWRGEEKEWMPLIRPQGRGHGTNSNAADGISVDDWVEFMGWYLSEGSSFLSAKSRGGTSPCVSIRQTKPAPSLKKLMNRLPWRVKSDGDGGYKIYSRQLYEITKPLGNSYTKRIPKWIKSLSSRQLSIFFNAFVEGDGSKISTGAIAFGLGSERLIDDLQEIALKLGRRSTKGYQRVKEKYDVYRLYVHAPQHTTSEVRLKHRKAVPYEGTVHCLTVEPNHTFLARYNGRIFWSGNSESQYRYLFSRLRRLKESYVPLRMRGASNPGGIGHEWVKQRFITEGKKEGRIFVPASFYDNPHLEEDYVENLLQLDPVTRAQLLYGDWTAREAGSKFKREWFAYIDRPPMGMTGCRYWDLAATAPKEGADPDYTVGVLLGVLGGVYYVCDVVRFRDTPAVVEKRIKQTAVVDRDRPEFRDVEIGIEEERGSSGILLADHYSRNVLRGFNFRSSKTSGDKEVRANPVSAAAEMGNIAIVKGPWLTAFLDEIEAFPQGSHDDQVDALSGSFSVLSEIPDKPLKVYLDWRDP